MIGPFSPDEATWLETERAFRELAPDANDEAIGSAVFRVVAYALMASDIDPPAVVRAHHERLARASRELLEAMEALGKTALLTIPEPIMSDFNRLSAIIQAHRESEVGGVAQWPADGSYGGVRPRKLRASAVTDEVAARFVALTGREPTITRPADGSAARGRFVDLLERVFRAMVIRDSVESQAAAAIGRRKRENGLQK